MQSLVFKQITLLGLFLITPLFAADDEGNFLKEITTIVDPNEAQWTIRNHIHDDENRCLDLFKDAMQQGNSVAQLYCANAYYAMQWDKEKAKAQGALKKSAMKAYNFVLVDMHKGTFGKRLNDLYRKANPKATNKKVHTKRRDIMRRAAATGNAFAQLALIDAQRCRSSYHRFNFGQACRLRALMKADGTFPFNEADEAFKLSLKKTAEHNELFSTTPYGELPATLFNLFEQHDMQKVAQLIQYCKLKWLHRSEIRLLITTGYHPAYQEVVQLRRTDATNEIAIVYDYEKPVTKLIPVIDFLKDAWSRCKNDADLSGIITDLKEHPEAFGASKDGW